MATKSQILEELKREEAQLAQELAKYKPVGRRKPAQRAPEQSAEEKSEIRKAKSRIAYKQRQLAFYTTSQQEEEEEEPQAVYVPNPPAKKAPAKRAPAKRASASVGGRQALPEPPQQPKGVQMVFVPGDGSDMGYEETVEVDDDEDGFDARD